MNWTRTVVTLLTLALALPASAVQPPPPGPAGRDGGLRSANRWVQQLENELDHLQEDLYYERGNYPSGLSEQVEETSRAVAHFGQMLRRQSDRQHLMRDFQEMDRQVHRLTDRLNQSGDQWLRRQAARIRYPDEQLHYALQTISADPRTPSRELLARHAHVLESEAKSLEELVDRIGRRDDRLRDAVDDFAEEAEHFHETVEKGADIDHLRDDFRDVDEAWHRVVEYINRSAYGLYLRRNAQNVNRVHNQMHDLLTAGHEPHQRVERDRVAPEQRVEPRRERPAIEFEIPGVGRFQIPR